MNKKIETLIPHRSPFLFVDEILSATLEEIVAVKTFDSNTSVLGGSFPDLSFVPGTILLESMAQAGGGGVRMLEITDGIFALVQIETAEFFGGAKFGQQVRYVIKNNRLSEKIIRQQGEAFVNGTRVMKASWMSIKIAERKDYCSV